MPVIGFMSGRSSEDSTHLVAAFRRGLSDAGFIEGQNIAIEFRWGQGQQDRLPALAAELVAHHVEVLVALGGDASAIAAKQATATIPVVFGIGTDPIEVGLVESFNRPGGNATGYTLLTAQLGPKRIGLLRELVPGVRLIGGLLNPKFPASARQSLDIETATRSIGQTVIVAHASNDTELNAAFVSLIKQGVGALLVGADPYFDTRRHRIVALAAQHRLPAIYQFREYAVSGGLISYGPRITDAYQQAGTYAGRIVRGAKPTDLPILQPTNFELVINLKTANALGLAVPNTMQLLADEVIE
jgi:putative tryptophan/tyrosine transport system substrate-binding protein